MQKCLCKYCASISRLPYFNDFSLKFEIWSLSWEVTDFYSKKNLFKYLLNMKSLSKRLNQFFIIPSKIYFEVLKILGWIIQKCNHYWDFWMQIYMEIIFMKSSFVFGTATVHRCLISIKFIRMESCLDDFVLNCPNLIPFECFLSHVFGQKLNPKNN